MVFDVGGPNMRLRYRDRVQEGIALYGLGEAGSFPYFWAAILVLRTRES